MDRRLIADELIRAIPIENLYSLIENGAAGLGKSTFKLPSDNAHLPVHISLFDRVEAEDGADTFAETGMIVVTPLPPNMRIQVYCDVGRRGNGFPPCQVAAEITRYLLRMVEGVERAEAWQPPWAVNTSPQQAAEAITVEHPQEHPDRKAKKDEVLKLILKGLTLREIEKLNTRGIPYSTIKVYKNELITEGRLPRGAKKPRKKPNPDSI